MLLEHEALALFVEENRAFAAHRFRDQLQRILGRVERGRMKLHELHVGELGARAVRDRVAIAGRHLRIRGVPIDLAASSGREHRRIRDYLDSLSRDRRANSVDNSVFHDEVEDARLLEHFDPLALLHPLDQRARDFGAGLISVRVYDAPPRMRRLAAELEVSARLEVEVRAGGRQLTDARGSLFDQNLHRLRIAERGTRGQRILPMQLRRISGAQCRGDPALSVGRRAVEQRSLGQHHHVAVRGSAPCSVKTSNSAPHHQKARTYPLGHVLKSMRDVRCMKGVRFVLQPAVFRAILLFR